MEKSFDKISVYIWNKLEQKYWWQNNKCLKHLNSFLFLAWIKNLYYEVTQY